MSAGTEWAATGIEFVNSLAFTQFGAKVVQFVGGLIGLISAGLAPGLSPNQREELIRVSNHLITRIADPSPEALAKLQTDIAVFVNAVRSGDVRGIQAALLRAPQEVQGALAQIANIAGMAVGRPMAAVPTTPTPAQVPQFPKRVGLVQVANGRQVPGSLDLIGRVR